MRRSVLVAIALLAFAGCLPSSQRGKTRHLIPADSLSRQIAATVPVDTLRLVWTGSAEGMELPTSLLWLAPEGADTAATADTTATPVGSRPSAVGGRAEGALVVADTRRGALRLFQAADGRGLGGEWAPGDSFLYPYLAGVVGDTVAVLLRGSNRLAWVPIGSAGPQGVARTVAVPESTAAALVTPRGIWAKRADQDGAWLVRLNARGGVAARYPLPGPAWRRFGFLRAWGDTTLSLSGYRPIIDVLAPGARGGVRPDSLPLVGFDSPELLRSHQFMLDQVEQPPLLTSATAPLGDRLFVVNLRDDHIRIDVYGRDGRLQRALIFPDREATQISFPVDMAVREDAGGVWIALLMQQPGGVFSQPGGNVVMLRWEAAVPAATTDDGQRTTEGQAGR